jgi:hypothetical protein
VGEAERGVDEQRCRPKGLRRTIVACLHVAEHFSFPSTVMFSGKHLSIGPDENMRTS